MMSGGRSQWRRRWWWRGLKCTRCMKYGAVSLFRSAMQQVKLDVHLSQPSGLPQAPAGSSTFLYLHKMTFRKPSAKTLFTYTLMTSPSTFLKLSHFIIVFMKYSSLNLFYGLWGSLVHDGHYITATDEPSSSRSQSTNIWEFDWITQCLSLLMSLCRNLRPKQSFLYRNRFSFTSAAYLHFQHVIVEKTVLQDLLKGTLQILDTIFLSATEVTTVLFVLKSIVLHCSDVVIFIGSHLSIKLSEDASISERARPSGFITLRLQTPSLAFSWHV